MEHFLWERKNESESRTKVPESGAEDNVQGVGMSPDQESDNMFLA